MGTHSADVQMATRGLQNESAILIKQLQQVINKLADIPKSQDNIKQVLREALCKPCRDKTFEIFQSPFKSYSNIGCQTKRQLFRSESSKLGKGDDGRTYDMTQNCTASDTETDKSDQNEGEQSIPHRKKEMEPSEKIEKLESLIQEVQDRERKTVEHLQDELKTVEVELESTKKEKDCYKARVEELEEETGRLRHQVDCYSEHEHKTSSKAEDLRSSDRFTKKRNAKITMDEETKDKFKELVRDLGEESERVLNSEQGKGKNDPDVINLQNENTRMISEIEKMDKRMSESNDEVNRLQNENTILKEDRDTRDTVIKSLREEKEKQTLVIQTLTEEKQNAEQKEQDLRNQLSENETKWLQVENQTGKQDKCGYYLRSKENKDKQTQLVEQLQQENANLQQNIDQLNNRVAYLKADLQKAMLENETLINKNDQMTKENEDICLMMNQCEQEKSQIQHKVENYEETLAQRKSQVEAAEKRNRNLTETLTRRDDELRSLTATKDTIHSKYEHVKKEKCEIQRELDEQKAKTKREKSNIKDTQNQNQTLTDTLDERNREVTFLKQEKDQICSQMGRIQQERDKIKRLLNEQQEKMDESKEEMMRIQNDNRNLTDTLSSRDEELHSMETEKHELKSQIEDGQREKQNIQRELAELKGKTTQAHRQLLKAKNDIQNLNKNLSISEDRLRTLQDNHCILKEEMKTLQQKHDSTKQDLDERTRANKKMEEENARLKSSCDKQIEELQKSNQQIEELKKPRKKRIVLGLRSERSGLGKPVVDMVTREMTTRLQNRLDMYNLNLVVSFSQVSSEVTNGFQIALCLNMSRVGTNIVDSIKGMKVDRDLFVMVVHHTNRENLSSLTPTSHRVTGSEVRQLGGILDMAFSSDSGLYDCDLNNAAMEKIAVILKKCLIL